MRVPLRRRGGRARLRLARRSHRPIEGDGAEHPHLFRLCSRHASLAPSAVLVLWFLACTGVGGMWPNGVALVAEAWSGMSRPAVAGVIGTAANIGIFLFATLAGLRRDHARRTGAGRCWSGAAPVVLGVFAWFVVPSRRAGWRCTGTHRERRPPSYDRGDVFDRRSWAITLVAIVLATIPMIGGWGTANWMNPWAEEASRDA